MAGIGQNPALKFVKEVRETRSLEEMAALMKEGIWLCIGCVRETNADGYLFSLGRFV